MKTVNAVSGFDALKMKEEIQATIYEETKGMSFEEIDAYHKQRIASSPIMSAFVQKLTKKAEDNTPVIPLPKKAAVA